MTKPSFMSVLPWSDKIAVGLTAAISFLLPALVFYAVCAIVSWLTPAALMNNRNFSILRLPQAAVLTVLLVLLVDNFSYTMAGTGISSTGSVGSLVYLLVVVAVFVYLAVSLSRKARRSQRGMPAWRGYLAIALMLSSTLIAVQIWRSADTAVKSLASAGRDLPNIVLFASDGIDADYISGYGFDRLTTPNLDALMKDSLVFESALSNAGRTTGSTVSMLNGKYPASTKVLFPPHVLTGKDAFEHLPGLLREQGYRLFQESIRYYADGPDLNMQLGFHVANRREVAEHLPAWVPKPRAVALASVMHFHTLLRRRVSDRAQHLTLVRPMVDVYSAVTLPAATKVYGLSDGSRIREVIDFISSANSPFFMHIHLMGTHCCHFDPGQHRFSDEHAEPGMENKDDLFLDTVRESDDHLGEVLQALERTGQLDNTLIVYTSDHTKGWRVNRRMPLVMRFPKGDVAGRVKANVQLMDLSPTIVDYLGMKVPEWMEGRSLLAAELDPLRPVYAISGVDRQGVQRGKGQVSTLVGSGPPLYGVKSVVMTVCHRWYSLSLKSGTVKSGAVKGHPEQCSGKQLPGKKKARRMIIDHLEKRGFVLPLHKYSEV